MLQNFLINPQTHGVTDQKITCKVRITTCSIIVRDGHKFHPQKLELQYQYETIEESL